MLYCFKSCAIIFKDVCVCVGGGGGGGDTLHEQTYRAIRLFIFYGWILNLVGYTYVCVCVCVGVMMDARSVYAQFPPYSIPEFVLEIG